MFNDFSIEDRSNSPLTPLALANGCYLQQAGGALRINFFLRTSVLVYVEKKARSEPKKRVFFMILCSKIAQIFCDGAFGDRQRLFSFIVGRRDRNQLTHKSVRLAHFEKTASYEQRAGCFREF